MRKAVAMIALSIAAGVAGGADGEGRFAIRGAGLLNCQNFIDARTHAGTGEPPSNVYLMIGGWIDGYITGINQYAEDTYDITSFESTELIAQVLANHCRDNPGERLYTVLNSLFQRVGGDRIRSGGTPVIVEVGDRSTRLYQPTVARVQNALRRRGLLQGKATGFYHDATIAAMREFQRGIGYEPTGFPDQASLWHLLWGETAE